MSLHTEFHCRLNYYLYDEEDENGYRHPYITRTQGYVIHLLQRVPGLTARYQFEKGSNGLLHWQMHISLKKAMNKYKLGCILGIDRKIWEYCEPAKNIEASKNYSMKSESRISGPYSYPEPLVVMSIENLMGIKPSNERTKKI